MLIFCSLRIYPDSPPSASPATGFTGGGGARMALFFCEHCRRDTKFLPIRITIQVAEVSRSTVYYWMDRAWVHWRVLPSGRRVICQESLSRQMPRLALDKES